jgi:hypothetical protein
MPRDIEELLYKVLMANHLDLLAKIILRSHHCITSDAIVLRIFRFHEASTIWLFHQLPLAIPPTISYVWASVI